VTNAEANTREELAQKLKVSPSGPVKTVREFNGKCITPQNPTGRCRSTNRRSTATR
jgi:hypothetical protein